MCKQILNFSYFYFLPFLKSSVLELQQTVTLLPQNQDLNKEQTVKSIIEYCTNNGKPIYQLDSNDQIEVTKTVKYPTGYFGWELNKEDAFKITQQLIRRYSGTIKINLFFENLPERRQVLNCKKIEEFDYLSFINVFLAFGLNLTENRKTLVNLLNECGVPLPNGIEKLQFFQPETYLESDKYFYPGSKKINLIVFFNDFLKTLRLDEYVDVKVKNPDILSKVLKNSIKQERNGSTLYGKLLGVSAAALKRQDLTGADFLLERFACFFNLDECELVEDFSISLSDAQKKILNELDDEVVFISPNIHIKTILLLPLLKGIYYLLLKYGTTKFFDSVGVSRSAISKIFKNESNSINFVYRLLHLLDLHENEDMQKVLVIKAQEMDNGNEFINLDLFTPQEIEEQAFDQVDSYLASTPKINDYELYGKLYALPQPNQPITQKLDRESLNSFFKNSMKATELLLNFLISQSGDFEYSEVLVSMHKLSTYRLNGFDSDEAIAFCICDNCSIKNNFASLVSKLEDKVFAFTEDKHGKIEYKLLQLQRDNSNDFIEFFDVSTGEYLYKMDLSSFCNNVITLCFPKVILFI